MRDEVIVEEIRTGRATASLEKLYRNFPMIRKMILSNGGNDDEAKDVFQESVIIFYRMCCKEGFKLTSSISTLLYSISRKIWLKRIRDYHSRVTHNLPEAPTIEDWEVYEEENDKIKIMEKALEELGDPCRELLVKFYYEKESMRDIADKMGYSGEKTAKAQKYKCLERAKKIVESIKINIHK